MLKLPPLPTKSNLLVAVSGGADSMALLCALVPLCDNLFVLHVNHNLRGQESKDDADFVRAFCEQSSVPCTIVTIPEGEVLAYAKAHRTGIEAAARYFRRDALLNEAKRLDKPEGKTLILTAHTKDDALELALMRIFRGSGPAGLSAMPVKRGRFVRPLLGVSRAEIIAYLKEKNIPWREDSSNTDERFLRNKIRHKLIPFLSESWKKGIEGMTTTQALVAEFLEDEVKKRIKWEAGETDEENFFSQPQIIREESIFQGLSALVPLCEAVPKRYVVRQFCEGNQKAADLGPVHIVRKKGKVVLSPSLERKRTKK